MVILVDNDFKIVVNEYGFDLYRLVTAKKKGEGSISNPTGESYTREDFVGYYTDLLSLIKRIIQIRLTESKDTISLKQFCEEYKKEVNRLEQLIGHSTK
jgi:hypothetical protein